MPAHTRVYTPEAVVLRRTDYGEADRILTLFTPSYGKVRAIAKGARRTISQLAGHLELLYPNTAAAGDWPRAGQPTRCVGWQSTRFTPPNACRSARTTCGPGSRSIRHPSDLSRRSPISGLAQEVSCWRRWRPRPEPLCSLLPSRRRPFSNA